MELTFVQEVMNASFNGVSTSQDQTQIDYSFESARGQQSIAYNVSGSFANEKANYMKVNAAYPTQEITFVISDDKSSGGEPAVLNHFDITKFGILRLSLNIIGTAEENFELSVPIDALSHNFLEKARVNSTWYLKMELN